MSETLTSSVARDLRRLLGNVVVPETVDSRYLADETEARGLHGTADAVVLAERADDVRAAVGWCYEHDVAIIPRGARVPQLMGTLTA